MDKRRKIIRIGAVVLSVLAVAVVAAYSGYMLWEEAPAVASPTAAPAPSATPAANTPQLPQETAPISAEGRKNGVYTLLLVGNDDGNGNTDTIMLGRLDTIGHKMDFVSIPRDTLINEAWQVRKINAVYWGDISEGGSGIDALKKHIAMLAGFEPDCYAVLDLDVFVEAVDLLGGVYFDVPQALDYDDAGQELYIHLQPGYQRLGGYDAMCLCRYRSGYIDGDIGRINMQHDFLKACAEQFISLGNIPNVGKLVELLAENMYTDMSAANIAFFLRNALMCKAEDVRFHTVPNTPATIHGYSYAVVDVWDWLPMINEYLNPYSEEVGWENVDIVYLSDGGYYGTAPLRGGWYYYEKPAAQAPAPAPTAEPEPVPTEAPAPVLPDLPQFTFPPLPGEDGLPRAAEPPSQ